MAGQDFNLDIAKEFGTVEADASTALDFLGSIPVFEGVSITQLVLRFLFNLLVCYIIVRLFYYKKSKRSDFFVTYIIFNSIMFMLLASINNLTMNAGVALGLFVVFGMIRYRTVTVPIREMTYLFVITGLAVVNGLAIVQSYAELVVINLLIIGLIAWLENLKFGRTTSSKLVLYERIDMITPDKREELIEDLKNRTGLEVTDVEIGHIDFLRDVAFINVSYPLEDGKTFNSIDKITRAKDFVE